ncbi:hypothetical protein E4O92_24235 [Massilia horti]|uniref:Uncharacterized protein n=2 Tax=Massilia horti TaxID=2562153 RepID=A0A4Y9SL09_9BURK|nr:hypothetical protein E4O92_24235 [Massilia horti]
MRALSLPGLLALSCLAHATNYTLWINGRNNPAAIGHYDDFRYWGPATVDAGVNKKAVNWDGYNSIGTQSRHIRDALDCFCTGENWCYIATHSAGDMIVGYTLANYGGSARSVKNAVANADGTCGDVAGAPPQTGWNIKWVRSAGGSAGGSELADAGRWTTGEPLVHEHKVSTARAMYNHNATYNVWFYMYAGSNGTLYSWLLPGQDDEVVAYHSSGAVAGSAGGSYCNPGDWFCRVLSMGAAANEGGWPKWANHSVAFRDDHERYSHYIKGNWGGITGMMLQDIQKLAR